MNSIKIPTLSASTSHPSSLRGRSEMAREGACVKKKKNSFTSPVAINKGFFLNNCSIPKFEPIQLSWIDKVLQHYLIHIQIFKNPFLLLGVIMVAVLAQPRPDGSLCSPQGLVSLQSGDDRLIVVAQHLPLCSFTICSWMGSSTQ